jgi:hypothetical protein
MKTRLKRVAAMCLVAGGVYTGVAGASQPTPEPDPPISNETRLSAPAAEADEHMNLPSRFGDANVHPCKMRLDAAGSNPPTVSDADGGISRLVLRQNLVPSTCADASIRFGRLRQLERRRLHRTSGGKLVEGNLLKCSNLRPREAELKARALILAQRSGISARDATEKDERFQVVAV